MILSRDTVSIDAQAPSKETAMSRVCIVSENLSLPEDEGGRKFTKSLIRSLRSEGPVLGISVEAASSDPDFVGVRANRLFINSELRSRIKQFDPDLVCYIPTASDTVFSFLRLKVLSFYARRAATALVALQPRPHGQTGRLASRALAPDIMFVQSAKRAKALSYIPRPVQWLPAGVDTDRFAPVSDDVKLRLREKYGLPRDEYLVLHVGHITPERNVAFLEEVQREYQVVMVAGNSTGEDRELRTRLEHAGVVVIHDYIEAVEEIYQASDCFVFPVTSDIGSIEIPLSVVEAMACNLPVVCTRFGGLHDMFGASASQMGLLQADTPQDIPELIASLKTRKDIHTRELTRPFSWESVAAKLVEGAEVAMKGRRKGNR